MKTRIGFLRACTTLAFLVIASNVFCSDDETVVGIVEWEPALLPDATLWDKTDYWAAISISPSTGKYASTCEWTARENAERSSREKCNAPDARTVVLSCNGWCALALGDQKPGKDFGWAVGWGPNQETAERFALQSAQERGLPGAKVVYSINSREMRTGGAIAFSQSTGRWGYSPGGGLNAPYQATQYCNAPDAKVIAQKSDCWMALAVGDNNIYGWGYAGNSADAQRFALEECKKQTTNAEVAFSFCTNGVQH